MAASTPFGVALLYYDHSVDRTTSQIYAIDLPPVSEFLPSRSPSRANSQGPSDTRRRSVVMTYPSRG